MAERFVQTLKQALKVGEKEGLSLQLRLSNFLLKYCITPQATSNTAPSSLFLNRVLRTWLDLIKPNIDCYVGTKQANQKSYHDQHATDRELFVEQNVTAKNPINGLWVEGVIIGRHGPVSYLVQLASGMIWKRHIDHIRTRSDSKSLDDHSPQDKPNPVQSDETYFPFKSSDSSETESPTVENDRSSRYPGRNRRPPNRYEPNC